LIISWFGGEPLLAYSTVVEVMNFVATHVRAIGQPVLKSGMTTNGSLLMPARLRVLVGLGVDQHQVTFDGDAAEHNALRVALNGRPTFETIWHNLLACQAVDAKFKIIIRLHANKRNAESMGRLIQRLGVALGGDTRFELYVRRLANGIGPNYASLPTLPSGTETVSQLIGEARGHGLSVHSSGYWHEGTCAASALNSFVIRADGRISKCLLVLDDERNTLGQLNADGTMSLDVEKLKWWSRGLVSNKTTERGCPASPLVETAQRTRAAQLVSIGPAPKSPGHGL
jgi:uncharacterized protein